MHPSIRRISPWLISAWAFVVVVAFSPCPAADSPPAKGEYTPILQYIHTSWDRLTRSMAQCDSIVDPKLPQSPILYLPADLAEPDSAKKLSLTCGVRVLRLPVVIQHPGQAHLEDIKNHGLLFLPNPYVVPGGRFNEMYGWDSYFIILGLLRDGRVDLARGMVDNVLFEIEHYGTVLNANRTYYLTRSQPPFLTSMISSVYEVDEKAGRADKKWLERAYDLAVRDYQMWTAVPHLAGSTGLSRYYDFGSGPAPESSQDEAGLRRQVAGYFMLHPELGREYATGTDTNPTVQSGSPEFVVQVCDARNKAEPAACDSVGSVRLTADYYKGDRSMRESGFDVSFRFEPYGAATHHFAPACLNSLLYKTEVDLATMARTLGKPIDVKHWERRAAHRKKLVNRYLWNAKRALFVDYNFEDRTQSTYEYATTFYPLWVGLASARQARAVLRNLRIFEQPGGIVTSTVTSGAQWDYPYGWAPLQLIAVEGLRRYGNNAEADRITKAFLETVLENFQREGTIREKYNVVTRSTEASVTAGYRANVVGFGWTNAVFVQLLHELPQAGVDRP